MLYLDYNEKKQHGSSDFPMEFYHVTNRHPRYEMPFHWHREYELVRILSGTFAFTLDGTAIIAHADDCVFIPSGVLHGGIPKDCLYECLVFDPDILYLHSDRCRQYLNRIRNQDIAPFSLISPDMLSLSRTLQRLFDVVSAPLPGYELTAAGLLLQFFGLVLQNGQYQERPRNESALLRNHEQLKAVFTYIDQNYAHSVSLSQLSQAAGMSAKYFCRYFQTITHRTPVEYLNYYRIEHACHLLCTTERPVTDIAYECGFNDCSYFIRLFRKAKATTPLQYRRKLKGESHAAC